jgi:hypothetical protein
MQLKGDLILDKVHKKKKNGNKFLKFFTKHLRKIVLLPDFFYAMPLYFYTNYYYYVKWIYRIIYFNNIIMRLKYMVKLFV